MHLSSYVVCTNLELRMRRSWNSQHIWEEKKLNNRTEESWRCPVDKGLKIFSIPCPWICCSNFLSCHPRDQTDSSSHEGIIKKTRDDKIDERLKKLEYDKVLVVRNIAFARERGLTLILSLSLSCISCPPCEPRFIVWLLAIGRYELYRAFIENFPFLQTFVRSFVAVCACRWLVVMSLEV